MIVTWSQFVSPSEPLDEASAKFIGMSRIVEGIEAFDQSSCRDVSVIEAAAQGAANQPFKQRRTVSKRAANLLRVAWGTELAARLGEQLGEASLVQATLQTLPVQAYYAVFSAARAFTEVAAAPKDTHAKIHAAFASEHYRRAYGAWSVKLTGDPEKLSTCQLNPNVCDPQSFNPMEMRAESADYVWAALRVARRWKLERARFDWLSDKKNRTKRGQPYKALPAGKRGELATNLRQTTLMDFLYELRCATNYRTTDEYTADVDDERIFAFYSGLIHLLNMGLVVYEAQIALYSGTSALRATFDDWTERSKGLGQWAAAPGRARINALAAAGI